jgi:hypothetical protein
MIADLRGIGNEEAERVWQDNISWFEENDIPIAIKANGTVSGVNGATLPKIGKDENGKKQAEENVSEPIK